MAELYNRAEMSTRKERRSAIKDSYLSGKARMAHGKSSELRRSLDESSQEPSCSTSSTGVCSQCQPVLSR